MNSTYRQGIIPHRYVDPAGSGVRYMDGMKTQSINLGGLLPLILIDENVRDLEDERGAEFTMSPGSRYIGCGPSTL